MTPSNKLPRMDRSIIESQSDRGINDVFVQVRGKLRGRMATVTRSWRGDDSVEIRATDNWNPLREITYDAAGMPRRFSRSALKVRTMKLDTFLRDFRYVSAESIAKAAAHSKVSSDEYWQMRGSERTRLRNEATEMLIEDAERDTANYSESGAEAANLRKVIAARNDKIERYNLMIESETAKLADNVARLAELTSGAEEDSDV